MSNWTYSEHDGKHIINDEQGVLVAMVCDAQTAELIVRQHKELAERDQTIADLTKIVAQWDWAISQQSAALCWYELGKPELARKALGRE
ncbi:hypothetical protein D1872_130720 [compost metagenome]